MSNKPMSIAQKYCSRLWHRVSNCCWSWFVSWCCIGIQHLEWVVKHLDFNTNDNWYYSSHSTLALSKPGSVKCLIVFYFRELCEEVTVLYWNLFFQTIFVSQKGENKNYLYMKSFHQFAKLWQIICFFRYVDKQCKDYNKVVVNIFIENMLSESAQWTW